MSFSVKGLSDFGDEGADHARLAGEAILSLSAMLNAGARAAGHAHIELEAHGMKQVTSSRTAIWDTLAQVNAEFGGAGTLSADVPPREPAPIVQILRYVQGLPAQGRMAFWLAVQQEIANLLDDGPRGQFYAFLFTMPLLAWVLHAPPRPPNQKG